MPKPAAEFVTQMHFINVKGGGRAPVLGFGTARLRGRECTHAVRMALDLGYRHIDTAELYANEREIGEAIAASGVDRADLFVTTKIWTNHFRGPDARQAAETSLRNLRTDYVDLLLMHFPNESVPLEETLGALAALVEAGKAVSNFSTPLLEKAIAASAAPIACDQVRYYIGQDQSQLLAFARPRGIFIIAYSPLGVGALAHLAVLKEIYSAQTWQEPCTDRSPLVNRAGWGYRNPEGSKPATPSSKH
jgi:2,5-diketo-D-gluconate reductase B